MPSSLPLLLHLSFVTDIPHRRATRLSRPLLGEQRQTAAALRKIPTVSGQTEADRETDSMTTTTTALIAHSTKNGRRKGRKKRRKKIAARKRLGTRLRGSRRRELIMPRVCFELGFVLACYRAFRPPNVSHNGSRLCKISRNRARMQVGSL